LNSRQTGEQNYDSAGRGASASLSAWTDRLVVNAGLSFTEADFLPIYASNNSRYYNAYATATLKLDVVPDLFVDINGYRSQYTDQSSHFASASWSSSGGLDFSKYLLPLTRGQRGAPTSMNFAGASLRALYRYQSGMDFAQPGHGPTGHFVGLSFRTALN
jgi:hypothetical protein